MSFPDLLFVIRDKDGALRVYENESEVGAPLDRHVEMATYSLYDTEQVRRIVSTILDRKPTEQPTVPPAVPPAEPRP